MISSIICQRVSRTILKSNMRLLKALSALLLCAASVISVAAQERPSWVDGYFNDLRNSYIKTVTATAYTEDEAFDEAVTKVMEDRSQESGMRVKVKVQSDGRIITTGGDMLTVKARVIDRYTEFVDGQYRVNVLVQVAKNPTFDFDVVKVTNDYSFSPEAFVPGMAQLKKGQKGKGTFFITAEAAFIGAIVVSECMRNSNTSKINTTHNAASRRMYADNADKCATARNVAIAGAVGIYLWNVIDGIVAKGKKHIVIADRATLDFYPYFSPDLDVNGGLSLCLKF